MREIADCGELSTLVSCVHLNARHAQWTVVAAAGPVEQQPSSARVSFYWIYGRTYGRPQKEPSFRFFPQGTNVGSYMPLETAGSAALLVHSAQGFVVKAAGALTSSSWMEGVHLPPLNSEQAKVLATTFVQAWVQYGHEKCKPLQTQRGSVRDFPRFFGPTAHSPTNINDKALMRGLVFACFDFEKKFGPKRVRNLMGDPFIQTNGDDVHVLFSTRESSSNSGGGGGGSGGGGGKGEEQVWPLQPNVRLLACDVGRSRLAFGGATEQLTRDVEARLLGRSVDPAKWPPSKEAQHGLHWVTSGTQEAHMATKQAERARSKEKERLDACMAPGGIHGLEQQQRDLGKCRTSEERRRAMRAWFTWLPFAEFLYNSRAARQRAHDRSIRWRRYLQQIEFGVTRDLVQALQRADAENKQYLDHSRPMAPQGRERRCQHCLLLVPLTHSVSWQERVGSQALEGGPSPPPTCAHCV